MHNIPPHTPLDHESRAHHEQSSCSALQYVGLLLLADRDLVETLLHGGPIDAAASSPGQPVSLNGDDLAMLSDIRHRVDTVAELLAQLAQVANSARPIA
jgi:hypothetical protein